MPDVADSVSARKFESRLLLYSLLSVRVIGLMAFLWQRVSCTVRFFVFSSCTTFHSDLLALISGAVEESWTKTK